METVRINDYEAKMVPIYLELHQMIYLYSHAVSGRHSMFSGVVFGMTRILVDSDTIYISRMRDELKHLEIFPSLKMNPEWYNAVKSLPVEL